MAGGGRSENRFSGWGDGVNADLVLEGWGINADLVAGGGEE